MTLTKKQKRYIFQFFFSGLGFAAFMSAEMYFIQEDFRWTSALSAFVWFGGFMTAFLYWSDKRKERKESQAEQDQHA